MPTEVSHMSSPPAASPAPQHSKRGAETHPHPTHAVVPAWADATLNDINAEIFGGRVRVTALLDARGLDKLERKIKALRVLIADDDEADGLQEESNDDQSA